jgi:aminoacrylate hydrolase
LTNSGTEAYVQSSAIFLYPPRWVNANAEQLVVSDRRAVESFSQEIGASRIDAVLAFDCADRLADIRSPTLVIVAEDDILTPPHFARFIADKIPGASLVVVNYGAHRFAHVDPETFNREVLAFLRK